MDFHERRGLDGEHVSYACLSNRVHSVLWHSCRDIRSFRYGARQKLQVFNIVNVWSYCIFLSLISNFKVGEYWSSSWIECYLSMSMICGLRDPGHILILNLGFISILYLRNKESLFEHYEMIILVWA